MLTLQPAPHIYICSKTCFHFKVHNVSGFFSALLFIEISEDLFKNLDDFKIVPRFCNSHTFSCDAKAEGLQSVLPLNSAITLMS